MKAKRRLLDLKENGSTLDDEAANVRDQLRFVRYYEERGGRQDSGPVVKPNTQLGMRGKPPRQRLPNT